MKLYVVLMLRWGNHSQDTYIKGIYSSHELAMKAGNDEHIHRGGKYDYKIEEFELDKHES